jgi:hypothetical protein
MARERSSETECSGPATMSFVEGDVVPGSRTTVHVWLARYEAGGPETFGR